MSLLSFLSPAPPSLCLQVPNEGSLTLVIILIVLQGVTGISFGLVISAALDDEQSANQASLGIFYPNLILSGRLVLCVCLNNIMSSLRLKQPVFS